MTGVPTGSNKGSFIHNALETVIRIGIVILLAVWCFDIVKPFIGVLAWAVIIMIAVRSLYERLVGSLGGRRKLASVIFTVLMLIALVTPTLALMDTLVEGAQQLAQEFGDGDGDIEIPLPPEQVAEWPIIGSRLSEIWTQASGNLTAALARFKPQIKAISKWLLSAAASAGFAVLSFVMAIAISGVLLVNADKGERVAERVFVRLADDLGEAYLELTKSTIRSVAQGILGVTLIQTMLAGLGFLVAGIPGAGVLAVVVLFLCIIQLGPTLVLLPTVIYLFMTADPLPAFAYLAWSIFVALIDNVLKPLLLGRGVNVPVLVVFLGAIGGFLSMGIIGLFVGSIVLVLGYTFLTAWLDEGRIESQLGTEA